MVEKNDITDYKINSDMTIDAKGNFYLYKYKEKELPYYIQFNIFDGDFCIEDTKLKTLKGCPKIVRGDFQCQKNNSLNNLIGGPLETFSYTVGLCENLISLLGGPQRVCGGHSRFDGLYIYKCPKLKYFDIDVSSSLINLNISDCESFEYFLKKIPYHCENVRLLNLPKLKSIDGIPRIIWKLLFIKNCPELKSLLGIEEVNKLSCIDTGKKFTKADVVAVGGKLRSSCVYHKS